MKDLSRSKSENEGMKRESGAPGGGKGRKDVIGRSGVFPMSGPHPEGNVEIKQQASWGQAERGAAGFENHGGSELTWEGGQLLGGLNVGPGGEPAASSEEFRGDFDIPHGQWLSFLDSFSRQHLGWMATIEVVSVGGRQTEAQERPLQGVSIDHGDGAEHAYVELGEPPRQQVTHVVNNPVRIRLKQSAAGEHQGLEIASADGSTTILYFRSMMRPETVNGMANELR